MVIVFKKAQTLKIQRKINKLNFAQEKNKGKQRIH